MPLLIFKRLRIGEAKPTRMSLQMVNRSIKHPLAVIEDEQAKVRKFIFPTDFVDLDMEKDQNIHSSHSLRWGEVSLMCNAQVHISHRFCGPRHGERSKYS